MGGQIWLGGQILIHKFYNKTMQIFFCACFVMAFLKVFAAEWCLIMKTYHTFFTHRSDGDLS